MTHSATPTLGDFLAERRFPFDAAAILGETDASTIWRITKGQTRARPTTIVRLAQGLGVSARRMKAMCDASWDAAHSEEAIAQ